MPRNFRLESDIEGACPQFLSRTSRQRADTGFQVRAVRTLLLEDDEEAISHWRRESWKLARRRKAVLQESVKARTLLKEALVSLSKGISSEPIQNAFEAVSEARQALSDDLEGYGEAAAPVYEKLTAVVDKVSDTTGWEDFLELSGRQKELREELLERTSRAIIKAEFTKALQTIDQAKELVLDKKFAGRTDAVRFWWEKLRPNEQSYFSGMGLRPGGRRNIDFKAGLSSNPDGSQPKVRDVVAVFSQSQLHCLGLATFFARADKYPSGFIVLDDPILASDEDHRAHFITSAVEELVNRGHQVIIITQDQGSWKNLQERYAHLNIDVFQLTLEEPLLGSSAVKTSDSLTAMLSRARTFVRNNNPDIRKIGAERLRDAAERFCKELLVKERRAAHPTSSLTDYDGKNLGHLEPLLTPHLTKDASHPGKLRMIAQLLNPGAHDDQIPSSGDLIVSLGDLEKFRKDYL